MACRHDNFLLLCQVVEVLLREFVGKVFEVFAQEHTRLMVAAVSRTDIIVVVVPIEPGLSLVLDQSEEGLFHAVEEVEADEGVVFHRGVEFRLSVSKAFHHAAVECAFVGLALFEQGGVEADVELGKDVPQLAVAFAEDVVVLRVEFGEEALQHRLLFVRQKLLLLNLLQVVEVLEEGFGIHHVLVHILEVVENPLCPSVEPVHADGLLREFLKESHDVQCRVDAVGHGEVRCQRFEEFADGGIAWSPCGSVAGEPEQVFVHIESGTLAGKDDDGAAEVAAGLAEEVFGDALEEGSNHMWNVRWNGCKGQPVWSMVHVVQGQTKCKDMLFLPISPAYRLKILSVGVENPLIATEFASCFPCSRVESCRWLSCGGTAGSSATLGVICPKPLSGSRKKSRSDDSHTEFYP